MSLAHDEAYYWVYSQYLDWGYYDHPPMVGWLIALFSFLGKTELAVRLPFILLQFGTIIVLWELAQRKNFAVFLCGILSFSLLQTAGFLALPDTAVLFFTSLFFIESTSYAKEEKKRHLVTLPFIISCMFYSKYHALLVVILAVIAMKDVIKRKSFWIIVGLTILLYLPHVWWQYQNDFVSLDFHLNQRSGKGFSIYNVMEYVGGQVALGGGVGFFYFLCAAYRSKAKNKLLYYNSLGFFLLILILSFRNRIEANWTVTAFAALLPLACHYDWKGHKKMVRNLIVTAFPVMVLIWSLRVILLLPKENYETSLLSRVSEVKNWDQKAKEIVEVSSGNKLYAETYQLASKLWFYGDVEINALAIDSRKSQFSLLRLAKPLLKDEFSYVTPNKPRNTGPESFKEVDIGKNESVFVMPSTRLEYLERK